MNGEGWHIANSATLDGTAVKIGPAGCSVGPMVIANLVAAVTWVELFDAATAASVTPGSTRPKLSISVAASASKEVNLHGLVFPLGLVACSATAAEGGTGANSSVMFGIG